jgi:hypothetical protein
MEPGIGMPVEVTNQQHADEFIRHDLKVNAEGET